MSPVPKFPFQRVVDLSRPLVPERENHQWFRYETRVESIVEEMDLAPTEEPWYVVTQLALSGHAGTHLEAPFHARSRGQSVGDLAVERFFGETVVLDLSGVSWGVAFDRDQLQRAAAAAGGIRRDDLVFLRFDWDRRSVSEGGRPPYPAPDALVWLVDQGVKLVGIDSPGLEVAGSRALANHHLLFDRGIPLIESLAQLDTLWASRVWVFAVPLPAFGTDAIPLRVLAFEG